MGATTYGKGVTQNVIEMMDGSAVILTDARLYTPNGTTYDGKGLDPLIPFDVDAHKLNEILKVIDEKRGIFEPLKTPDPLPPPEPKKTNTMSRLKSGFKRILPGKK